MRRFGNSHGVLELRHILGQQILRLPHHVDALGLERDEELIIEDGDVVVLLLLQESVRQVGTPFVPVQSQRV